MVTDNDKISLIIDVNHLFDLNDPEVQEMISGDTYKISELYSKNLKLIRNNLHCSFQHFVTREAKPLNEWMNYYQCDINDPKSIVIFLRIAEPILV